MRYKKWYYAASCLLYYLLATLEALDSLKGQLALLSVLLSGEAAARAPPYTEVSSLVCRSQEFRSPATLPGCFHSVCWEYTELAANDLRAS